MSIVDALDDYPAGQKPLSLSFSHHYDASLKCVQVTAIGYLMDALQKRNMKLANSILTHIVWILIYIIMYGLLSMCCFRV